MLMYSRVPLDILAQICKRDYCFTVARQNKVCYPAERITCA